VRLVATAALALIALGTSEARGDTHVGVAPTVRIVTLNLLHGGVLSGLTGEDQALDERLEIVVEGLRALAPDVVGLQEASTGRRRGSVAQRLAERLGLDHHVYATSLGRLSRHPLVIRTIAGLLNFSEGPAILSRFPILDAAAYDLPRCGRTFDFRVLLAAEIATPWGPLPVFSTHTSGSPCQTARVADLVRERQGASPGILMGDFNAVEGSPAIRELTATARFVDAYRAANREATGATVWQRVDAPEPTVRRRVDYLFLAPGTHGPGRVVASRVVLDAPRRYSDGRTLWPSDHYGVLADVALPPLGPSPASGYGLESRQLRTDSVGLWTNGGRRVEPVDRNTGGGHR
jgi:endonuclease/exonuclease/phosphatase family metal-dependent hydrolase